MQSSGILLPVKQPFPPFGDCVQNPNGNVLYTCHNVINIEIYIKYCILINIANKMLDYLKVIDVHLYQKQQVENSITTKVKGSTNLNYDLLQCGLFFCSFRHIFSEFDKTILTKLIAEKWQHGEDAKKKCSTETVRQSYRL